MTEQSRRRRDARWPWPRVESGSEELYRTFDHVDSASDPVHIVRRYPKGPTGKSSDSAPPPSHSGA